MNTKIARQNMLSSQLETNEVNDKKILAALNSVPREDFVPSTYKKIAYLDEGISFGDGKFLTSPMVFARMLVAANLHPKAKVLDIASTSGYSSAVLSHLAKKVFAIDDSTKITSMAKSNIAKLNIKNITLSKAPLKDGLAKEGPYDVIFINGAVDEIPQKIFNQLRNGGRLVAVVDGFITSYDRSGNSFATTRHFQANARSLPDFQKPKGFEF